MTTLKTTLAAGLILAAAFASAASAQTVTGGRTGPRGHGYNYMATTSGSTTTGSVTTNGGYGATATHTGGANAYGARFGTTTVNANNGATATTRSSYSHGVASGTVTATSAAGKTVHAGGAVYAPR